MSTLIWPCGSVMTCPREKGFAPASFGSQEALGQMLRDGHIEVVRDVVDRVNQSIEDEPTGGAGGLVVFWVHLGWQPIT